VTVLSVRACLLSDVPADSAIPVDCAGRQVCLSLVDGVPVAVEDRCPHRQVALSGGLVRDGVVTCPGHFRRFDLRTGRCLHDIDSAVPAYPCRVDDGWVVIDVPPVAPVLSLREQLLAHARSRRTPPAPS
jgi:nitrite reductase/ring-hydroxylating ferredoxin subunit